MSVPYMPLFVADYESDTLHLSVVEDGAYMRLLRLQWRTAGCTMPADEDWIQRRVRATDAEWEAIYKPLLDEFFTCNRGRIYQARLRREWENIAETSAKRSAAGKRGARARKSATYPTGISNREIAAGPDKALKNNETTSSPAQARLKHPEPEPELDIKEPPDGGCKKTENPSKQPESGERERSQIDPLSGDPPPVPERPPPDRSRGSRLAENWVLPREWGDWAIQEGMDELTVRRTAEKFRDHWLGKAGKDGRKANWLATWRNWVRRDLDDRRRRGLGPTSGGVHRERMLRKYVGAAP